MGWLIRWFTSFLPLEFVELSPKSVCLQLRSPLRMALGSCETYCNKREDIFSVGGL